MFTETKYTVNWLIANCISRVEIMATIFFKQDISSVHFSRFPSPDFCLREFKLKNIVFRVFHKVLTFHKAFFLKILTMSSKFENYTLAAAG